MYGENGAGRGDWEHTCGKPNLKSSQQSQFIQIAVAPDGDRDDRVYALDSAGTVWWFDWQAMDWNILNRKRDLTDPDEPSEKKVTP